MNKLVLVQKNAVLKNPLTYWWAVENSNLRPPRCQRASPHLMQCIYADSTTPSLDRIDPNPSRSPNLFKLVQKNVFSLFSTSRCKRDTLGLVASVYNVLAYCKTYKCVQKTAPTSNLFAPVQIYSFWQTLRILSSSNVLPTTPPRARRLYGA